MIFSRRILDDVYVLLLITTRVYRVVAAERSNRRSRSVYNAQARIVRVYYIVIITCVIDENKETGARYAPSPCIVVHILVHVFRVRVMTYIL